MLFTCFKNVFLGFPRPGSIFEAEDYERKAGTRRALHKEKTRHLWRRIAGLSLEVYNSTFSFFGKAMLISTASLWMMSTY